MRQALCCYHLLYARRLCEQGINLLTKTKTSELSEVELEDRYLTLAEAYKDLAPLDEIEPLARKTLDGLGLPVTIEEFENYDGNRCRIKLDIERILKTDELVKYRPRRSVEHRVSCCGSVDYTVGKDLPRGASTSSERVTKEYL